ncbi:hypothetical protein GCM10009007_17870 [Formosimonas limnophila]|uniref:Uncharacterized protein n=1 Tax=Formosimonas limnophila TaxID=1384487 RepID=A0A8J3FZT7_9BURK|nr:hypothetical protein GCM10009007_17870 [Formosimonas limnophila]
MGVALGVFGVLADDLGSALLLSPVLSVVTLSLVGVSGSMTMGVVAVGCGVSVCI